MRKIEILIIMYDFKLNEKGTKFKMKKKICIIILTIIIISGILIFTRNREKITINIDELAEDIINSVKFDDELNMANNETVEKLYNISNSTYQKVYISSGATAEEVAIFEFENKKETNSALEEANKRIEEQKENFRNYMPKEIKKLEDAIIITKNNYLIICITDDEEGAEKTIKKYVE